MNGYPCSSTGHCGTGTRTPPALAACQTEWTWNTQDNGGSLRATQNNGGSLRVTQNNGGSLRATQNNGGSLRSTQNNGGSLRATQNNGGSLRATQNNGGSLSATQNNGGSLRAHRQRRIITCETDNGGSFCILAMKVFLSFIYNV